MKKIASMFVVFIFVVVMCAQLGAATIPTGSITNVVTGESSITFNYGLNDPDSVVLDTQDYFPTVSIYDDTQLVESVKAEVTQVGTFKTVTFDGLDVNKDYGISVNAPYDLQGFGEPINEEPYTIVKKDVKTNKRAAFGYIHTTLDDVASKPGYNNLSVAYDLVDIDDSLLLHTGVIPKLIIYEGENQIDEVDIIVGTDQVYNFTQLNPDTEYKIQLTGLIDINNDGQPDNENDYILDEIIFKSNDVKVIPEAMVHQESGENPTIIGESSIEVHYDLSDSDYALINEGTIRPKVALFKNGLFQTSVDAQVGENNIAMFTGLEQGSYSITVTGQYDLNEDGEIENNSPFTLGSRSFVVGEMIR